MNLSDATLLSSFKPLAMEFLLSLFFWVFGMQPNAPAPSQRVISDQVIQAPPAQNPGPDFTLQRVGPNIRSAHAIIIFEDTHFRPVR